MTWTEEGLKLQNLKRYRSPRLEVMRLAYASPDPW
jgi:hypothetical protein